jgi:hypothetical protein
MDWMMRLGCYCYFNAIRPQRHRTIPGRFKHGDMLTGNVTPSHHAHAAHSSAAYTVRGRSPRSDGNVSSGSSVTSSPGTPRKRKPTSNSSKKGNYRPSMLY